VAALAYSGAVTSFALGAFVLPGVVLAAVSAATAARLSLWGGLLAGGAVALAFAELVNLLAGNENGPAARSTFAAGLFTAVAVAAVLGPVPAGFLVGAVGVVAGALALGAGSEVGPVAIATTVVAVVALAMVERRRAGWVERPPGRLTVPLLAILVGAAVAAVVLVADRETTAGPAVLSQGSVDDSIRPSGFLELPTLTQAPTRAPTRAPTQAPTPTPSTDRDVSQPVDRPVEDSTPPSTFWLVLAVLVCLLVVAVLTRVLWVALAWRRLRRRLRRGSPHEQVGGAWVWASRRLVAAGLELPISLSVDAVATGQGTSSLPRTVRPPLVALARAAETAIFTPTDGPNQAEVAAAWEAADRAAHAAVGSLGAGGKAKLAVRPISSPPSRPTRLPDDLVEMRS